MSDYSAESYGKALIDIERLYYKRVEALRERRCEVCGYAEHHREHTNCLRVENAALRAELAALREQQPVAWMYEYRWPFDGTPVWRFDNDSWNGQKPKSSKPLYAKPTPQSVPVGIAPFNPINAASNANHRVLPGGGLIYPAKPSVPAWIKTASQLPTLHRTDSVTNCARSEWVLGAIFDPDDEDWYFEVTYYRRGGQGDDSTCYWWNDDAPDYWMPLPEAPKPGDSNGGA